MSHLTMTEPVILKNGFRIGLVALLQTVAPAVEAVGFLYFLGFAFDARLESYFHPMAVLVAAVAAVSDGAQPAADPAPAVCRWRSLSYTLGSPARVVAGDRLTSLNSARTTHVA